MFATVSIKKLHGLTSHKCNTRQTAQGSLPADGALNSDQVISNPAARTATGRRAPDPGLKLEQVNTIVWFFQDHKWKQRHASVKRQAPSVKHQAPIFRKLSNQPG
jgi:hypothetical protein